MSRSEDGVERLLGRRDGENDWRADARAASHHGRLADELRMPSDERDPERARELCARICRDLLGDLAPALIPLGRHERRRVQALAAHTRMLFDFALQRGMHGERLAQINRWEFDLERALHDEPPGQPALVAMAMAEKTRPWPRRCLRTIMSSARRAALKGGLPPEDHALVAALFEAASGQSPPHQVMVVGNRLLGLVSRSFPTDDEPLPTRPPLSSDLNEVAMDAESPSDMSALPIRWRRVVRYLDAASKTLTARGTEAGVRLGIATRLRLLVRAYLGSQ